MSAKSARGTRQVQPADRFSTLDDYLAWLERRSHLGGSWYREVRPGVYQLQTDGLRSGSVEEQRRTFTREELARKFGFAGQDAHPKPKGP